jgi:hypothetical protein
MCWCGHVREQHGEVGENGRASCLWCGCSWYQIQTISMEQMPEGWEERVRVLIREMIETERSGWRY